MTITREHGEYVVVCDTCDDKLGEGETFESFQDAVDALRELGWKLRRGIRGEWQNICPSCP